MKEPPRVPRMAEVVAESLRRRIVSGDLDNGDELPREAVLLEEFEVSRPSLREAVRILETEGLLRIRRGKVGGAIVSRPTAASAAYHLGLTLQSNGATLDDLAAARSVIEPACAGLCAGLPKGKRNKLVKDLKKLVEANEALIGEGDRFTVSALEFHEALVARSGSTTIEVLAGALEAVWGSQERLWAKEAASGGQYPDLKDQEDVIHAHRRIITLIEAGDVDGVNRAMRKHLARSQPYVNYHQVPIQVVEPVGATPAGR